MSGLLATFEFCVLFLLLLWVLFESAILNGCIHKRAVQLSEAVVGGWMPWRLVQQTVCGVFQFGIPGNNGELRAQGDAVAIKTVGAHRVRVMREMRWHIWANWHTGGAHSSTVKTWVLALMRFLSLQHWEEWKVCQWSKWWQASESVCSWGGEGSVR